MMVLCLFAVPAMALAASQTAQTSAGTLDVRVSYTDIQTGEPAPLIIEFINPATGQVQLHVDYTMSVSNGSGMVFGPTPMVHSTEGVIRGNMTFPEAGIYSVDLTVAGILFQPIPEEVVSVAIPVAVPAAMAQAPPPDSGGGCLIATAVYGTESAQQVQRLREIRDSRVMATDAGRSFMDAFNGIYYAFSPALADMQRESPPLRAAVSAAIQPALLSLGIMEHAHSQEGVLFYGIMVILLNAAVYLAAPILVLRWACRHLRAGGISPHMPT